MSVLHFVVAIYAVIYVKIKLEKDYDHAGKITICTYNNNTQYLYRKF